MKLNKRFLGIFLSLSFAISFCVAASATEKERKDVVENVVIDNEDIKNRVDAYGKIKFILEKFGLFDKKIKYSLLMDICSEKMEGPIGVFRKILLSIYKEKAKDLKLIIGEVVEKASEIFTDDKIAFNFFEGAKKDIKDFLADEINNVTKSLGQVKKEYEEKMEGEKFSKISKAVYEVTIKGMKQNLERFRRILIDVKNLNYDKFKD